MLLMLYSVTPFLKGLDLFLDKKYYKVHRYAKVLKSSTWNYNKCKKITQCGDECVCCSCFAFDTVDTVDFSPRR